MNLNKEPITNDELLKLFNDIVWPHKMPPLPNTRELMLRFAETCRKFGFEQALDEEAERAAMDDI